MRVEVTMMSLQDERLATLIVAAAVAGGFNLSHPEVI